MNAATLFVRALENEGVEYIFGIPGEENLDFLEALSSSSIQLILTRHEQAAGFMAACYGRLTGKPGVCLSTLGPGATNLVTAAAYAQLGGMPLVMITGQKPIKKSKQGQFQIVDVVEMMRPITKFTRQIVDGSRIPSIVREAFRLASEERPGSVHIELPEDVAAEEVSSSDLPFAIHKVMRPYPDPGAITTAATMIAAAKRPLVLIGAGANRNRTGQALSEFITKTGIPFFNTQMGKGVVDERHPLYLGTAALSDNDVVHHAIRKADLIINVGHDVVEKPPFFMERAGAKVLHINFFSAKVDDVYFPQHEVVGDITNTIVELTKNLKVSPDWDFAPFMKVKNFGDRLTKLQSATSAFPVKPSRFVADVREAMPSDGIVCLDNGLYKLWFARQYRVHALNSLLLDNAFATMGAGLPSAIAAKLVDPSRKVITVCGDGGFMMNAQELETAIRLNLDLVVVILNDNAYGMIKWKQAENGQRNFGLDFKNPDFVAFAQCHGAHGHRIERTADFLPQLKQCLDMKGVHIIDVPFNYGEEKLQVIDLDERLLVRPSESKVTSEPLEVRSPHDQRLVERLELQDADAVEAALSVATRLFRDQSQWLPAHERIAILERLAELVNTNRQRLIETAVAEGGKPYADTVVELERAIQGVKLGIQAIHNLTGEQVPMGLTKASMNRLAFTFREPIGVVAAISAFNHPINLIVHQLVPAIAAGCPVIIKPASTTPLSCIALVELIHQAGLPKEWCQVLLISNKNSEKFFADKRVAYLSFIGSARVGWWMRSKLAPGTRCALEHGGSAPVIVDSSADFNDVIAPLVKGAFYHAGQVCVSSKRIYVPASRMDEFAGLIVAKTKTLKVGDPAKPETEVGPMIRASEVTRIDHWVKEAVAGGAKLLAGGNVIAPTYYEPTVLLNPPLNVKVSTDEIFGPVVCLYSYEKIDDALDAANGLPLAFQAAVFSSDIDMALHCVKRLNATAVMVNDHTAFRVDWMPFGGRGESGIGMGGIPYTAHEMSQEKLMVLKSSKL